MAVNPEHNITVQQVLLDLLQVGGCPAPVTEGKHDGAWLLCKCRLIHGESQNIKWGQMCAETPHAKYNMKHFFTAHWQDVKDLYLCIMNTSNMGSNLCCYLSLSNVTSVVTGSGSDRCFFLPCFNVISLCVGLCACEWAAAGVL